MVSSMHNGDISMSIGVSFYSSEENGGNELWGIGYETPGSDTEWAHATWNNLRANNIKIV